MIASEFKADWDDLRYILVVYKNKTFTAAAEQLSVSHTTIARRIKDIEARTGVQLFISHQGGNEPTDRCLEMVAAAEKIEAEVHRLESRVIGADSRLSGNIRLTAPDFIIRRHTEDFRGFQKQYPEISLEILATYNELNINRREADVAIRVTNTPPEHLLCKKLGTVRFAIYGAADIAEHQADTPLSAHRWISWDETVASARIVDPLVETIAPGFKASTRVDNMAVLTDLVSAGMGLTMLPEVVGDSIPGLTKFTDSLDTIERQLWLITHLSLRGSRRIRVFIDFFADAMRIDSVA